MERLKKRCLAASFSGHFLLLLLVLGAPLLLTHPPVVTSAPVLNIIPASILEDVIGTGGKPGGGATQGGAGSPAPGKSAPQPPAPPKASVIPPVALANVQPEVATKPKSEKSKKPSKPEPAEEAAETDSAPKLSKHSVVPDLSLKAKNASAKPKPSKSVALDSTSGEPDTAKPSKRSVQPNLSLAKRAQVSESGESAAGKERRAKAAADALAAADAARKAGEARGSMIHGIADRLGNGLSGGLSIEGLAGIGDGIGGDGTASYGQVIMSIYQRAWREPEDLDQAQYVVRTEVEIRRDGTVISTRVITPCRSEAVNRTVRRALDTVKFIAPFPATMKENSKVFTVDFDVQAKRQIG